MDFTHRLILLTWISTKNVYLYHEVPPNSDVLSSTSLINPVNPIVIVKFLPKITGFGTLFSKNSVLALSIRFRSGGASLIRQRAWQLKFPFKMADLNNVALRREHYI